MRKIPLGELPVSSTEFGTDVELRRAQGRRTLTAGYEEQGVGKDLVLAFEGVRAHAHRSEGACSAWHVQDTFDTVCEIPASPWLAEINALAVERGYPRHPLHHYLIYLDSFGCCAVVATGWVLESGSS